MNQSVRQSDNADGSKESMESNGIFENCKKRMDVENRETKLRGKAGEIKASKPPRLGAEQKSLGGSRRSGNSVRNLMREANR